MSSKRRVAVSIAVSDARPLPFLSGALNGANAFHKWAAALGYDARLLTDETEPVTLQRVREELEAALKNAPIHRFVIYFAGHGIIRELEEGLWLLSDWHKELRGLAIEGLKRRLRMFGIQQVSIFADACRSLPPDVEAADLVADAVLGKGPERALANLAVDKFFAAQDGSSTFAVPGPTPEKDQCLFSGVLMEGLWGANPTAFSKVVARKITSSSLRTYLEAEVPRRAGTYSWVVKPIAIPTFPEEDNVYFGDDPVPAAPNLPVWPPPAEVLRMGANRPPFAHGMRGGHGMGFAPGVSVPTEKSSFEQTIRTQPVPQSFETRAGFALDGARVVKIWTDQHSSASRSMRDSWWRVGRFDPSSRNTQQLALPTPALIELDSGLFAATVALPESIASILCDSRGVASLVYRRIDAPEFDVRNNLEVAARALATLDAGALRADQKSDLAVELRRDKHADPVLGVLSAYLYDSVADVDSIRRMAYFYVQHYQPIPYDIALLGQLDATERDQRLFVKVPPVASRRPRTDTEAKAEWTYTATPEAEGVVGGLWPWLRQGWPLLDDPIDSASTLVNPGLLPLIPQVTSGRFATLTPEGGQQLIQLFRLVPWQ